MAKTYYTEEVAKPDPHRSAEPQRVATSRRGMVATAHWGATSAGVEMLSEGGNAVDAAVASAFALGVCEPAASGLGGQTMMMIRSGERKRVVALDGSSRAPHRATPGSLSAKHRRWGYRATTVPSTLATLAYALERFGTLPLMRVLEPSIRFAEEGYGISELQNFLTKRERRGLRRLNGGTLFLDAVGRAHKPGTLFKQPALANTLRRIAKEGVEDFYQGEIAAAIEADMIANDGLIYRDDLAQIPWPRERRPISCQFEDKRVRTFPLPGAGRTLIEMLNIYSKLPPSARDFDSPAGAVMLARVIQRVFQDRKDRPFDPDFYPSISDQKMLSEEYAAEVAAEIAGRGETTHLCVMDAEGDVVALTQSIERVYGAGVVTPELGFLYNNYMTAFETKDITHPYYLRPGGVPWASAAPTIVLKRRKPWLAIGSPGSERITPSILQVLLRLNDGGPFEAVAAPRLHASFDGKVSFEAERFSPEVAEALEEAGFELDVREPFSFYLGCVQLVLREKEVMTGVADPRRDGSAGKPKRRR